MPASIQEAFIIRSGTASTGTPGKLVLPDRFEIKTLELPWRNNHSNLSCIPCGEYDSIVVDRPLHGGLIYQLIGVPDRTGIEIHSGNFAGDVIQSMMSNSEGCILIGHNYQMIENQLGITESRMAMDELRDHTKMVPLRFIITSTGDEQFLVAA